MALGNVELVAAFRVKGKQFASTLKMGRTQLQDAVPKGPTVSAWRLFALFAAAIFSLIVGVLPGPRWPGPSA